MLDQEFTLDAQHPFEAVLQADRLAQFIVQSCILK